MLRLSLAFVMVSIKIYEPYIVSKPFSPICVRKAFAWPKLGHYSHVSSPLPHGDGHCCSRVLPNPFMHTLCLYVRVRCLIERNRFEPYVINKEKVSLLRETRFPILYNERRFLETYKRERVGRSCFYCVFVCVSQGKRGILSVSPLSRLQHLFWCIALHG